MEFHKFELTSKYGFWKRKQFVATDENGALLFLAKHPTMWKRKMILYNQSGMKIATIERNVWASQFDFYQWQGNQRAHEATIKILMSIKSRLEVNSLSSGDFKLIGDMMMKEYKFVREDEDELAIAIRQSIKLRAHFGCAVSHKADPELILACLLVVLWRADMGS